LRISIAPSDASVKRSVIPDLLDERESLGKMPALQPDIVAPRSRSDVFF